MKALVAVVICVLTAAPVAGASFAPKNAGLVRTAARLSGLPVRRAVTEQTLSGRRYDAALASAAAREYPRCLRNVDESLYARLGLLPSGVAVQLTPKTSASRAWYDPRTRKLLLRRAPAPQRRHVINELVHALVDQNFDLRRLRGLRGRDRDRALAADGIVDGTAALAADLRSSTVRGTPLERFLQLDSSVSAGRALAAELRYLGGSRAIASALRSFPRTTEQLLHVDKFLEREPALPIGVPARVGRLKLRAVETFGELDVRSLLRAFGVPGAAAVAEGWGGGSLALYVSSEGQTTAALALRWDTFDDATEWRAAVSRYVGSAFPGAAARECPPLDGCWSGASELAAAALGTTSVFASGPDAATLAGAVLKPYLTL